MNRKNHDVEKRRYWQRTIGDAARSGMSIREFCRQRRVKESQFYWWQRKLKAGRQERNKPRVQDRAASFALVSEDGMDTPAGLELVLQDGRRLRISQGVQEETLRAVLAAMESGESIRILNFPAAIKVYLCTVPCDMRRSFDGLSMMAEHVIRCNPFSGHLLVFCNRRTDRLKILYWDRDGWTIWYKRRETGTFQFPFSETGRKEIAAWELGLLLEGTDPSKGQRRERYSLPETTTLQENQPMDVAQKCFSELPAPYLARR